MILQRTKYQLIQTALTHFSALGLIGARQIGKTTLALELAKQVPSIYLDLENPQDSAKLSDPISYFDLHQDKLIILDEIQTKPDIFRILRGVIDKQRRAGHKFGQFLILGSASVELLRQSSESLAGRIRYIELAPLNAQEIINTPYTMQQLWLCGGFPDSLLAPSAAASLAWRQAFIKTYLERDIPQLGPRIPSETLRRFWIMLAHCHGGLVNAAKLAGNLGVSGQTITRYIDLFVDLFLIRRLQPWHSNVKKRVIRSPKIYVRDSGILHALLNIHSQDDLITNPILGTSWEGFVIDNIASVLPEQADLFFYRTVVGAEIDLLIKHPDGRLIAIEMKCTSSPQLSRGFFEACDDLQVTDRYVVYPGNEKYPLRDNVMVISLLDMLDVIKS